MVLRRAPRARLRVPRLHEAAQHRPHLAGGGIVRRAGRERVRALHLLVAGGLAFVGGVLAGHGHVRFRRVALEARLVNHAVLLQLLVRKRAVVHANEAKGVSPDVPKLKNRLAEKAESWYNSHHEEDNQKRINACRRIEPKVYEYGFLKK